MTVGRGMLCLARRTLWAALRLRNAGLAVLLAMREPVDRIDIAACMMMRSGGQMRIEALARWAELSERQFALRFAAPVGLNPKLYSRTIRLNAVFEARRRLPEARWTDLAHDAGYGDQAHFVRECRDLTGALPADFFSDWARLPST